MRRVRRSRYLLAVTAATLGILAGCSSPSTTPASDEKDSLAELRQEAALAMCPAPGVQASMTAVDKDLLPDLTLPCLGGGQDVPLRQLTGVPTVLNLWATWCGPCRQEMPAFQKLHQKAGDSLRVVGVVTQDPGQTRPLSYLIDIAARYPSLVDDDGDLARELAVRGLPATIFLDANGTVVHVYNGAPLTYEALADLVTNQLQVPLDG